MAGVWVAKSLADVEIGSEPQLRSFGEGETVPNERQASILGIRYWEDDARRYRNIMELGLRPKALMKTSKTQQT